MKIFNPHCSKVCSFLSHLHNYIVVKMIYSHVKLTTTIFLPIFTDILSVLSLIQTRQ